MKDSPQHEIGAMMARILAEVIETVSGFNLDVAEDSRDAPLGERTGVLSFTGNRRGMVFVSASEKDMKTLCSYITGMPPEEVSPEDSEDSLCELINMLSGSAALELPDDDYIFMIPWQYVIKGTGMAISPKSKVPSASWLLRGSEVSVGIKVIIDPGNTGKRSAK